MAKDKFGRATNVLFTNILDFFRFSKVRTLKYTIQERYVFYNSKCTSQRPQNWLLLLGLLIGNRISCFSENNSVFTSFLIKELIEFLKPSLLGMARSA